tara:strand:- start:335 stop:1051 length:717 start_codon:yes stop_codon:yes gene_type:complete
MATTIATISLSSSDLLSSVLAFSSTNPLNTAGSATGLSLTSGLARTTTSYASSGVIESTNLYRSNDATDNGSNKVYLKNMSTTPAEYYTVFIDQEEMGRLYAGDWAFFPWSAKSGTKENFVMTVGGTWVAGETLEFDGVLTTAANTTVADIAAQVDAEHYPNWTTTISGAAVTFTARHSMDAGTVVTATADMVIVQTGGSDATAVVSSAAMGTATDSDIMIIPSVHTAMTLEHMLFHE